MIQAGFETDFFNLKSGLQTLESNEVDAFKNRFGYLKKTYDPVQTIALAQKRKMARFQAPDFNIFRILGVQHLEDNTHSPFLAQLLNPLGTHGQGALFLRAFLEQFSDEAFAGFPLPESEFGNDGWKIAREVYVGDGYLDMVIRNNSLGCLYIIENKINALEQPKQIERYQQWLEKQTRYPRRALIFLTPGGRQPLSGSAFCISYQEDVAAWLDSVIEEINAPKVRETVHQYLSVICTAKEKAVGYEDKVLDFIGQPENVATALEINSYVEKLKAKTHWQFWSMVNARLDELFQASTYRSRWTLLKMSKKELNKGYVGCHLVPQSAIESIKIPYLRFPFRQFHLGNKEGLYYGVRWIEFYKTPETHASPELDLLVEQLQEQQLKTYPPKWLAWCTLGHPLLAEDFLVKMTNNADEFVNQLVESYWEIFETNVEAVEVVNKAVFEGAQG